MVSGISTTPAVKASALSNFRPDIQGLRALAVVVVVLDHLFGWPTGGFVGVDVFFVISGFLITGLMLKEHQRSGRISWAGFYKRRVRRIMPASTVCLAIVVAASYVIYRAARFDSIKDDAIWSFFFASNWHFAEVGTDYFQANGPVSPLQHFWSLAVEEQFYIVWPGLLILVLGVIGRPLRVRGRSANKALTAVIVAVITGSFLWAMMETSTSPTWAYFSTFTRGWELAAGALLAVGATRLTRIPAVVRPVMSYAGLVAIIASLFLITPTSSFPGQWAVVPVGGAVLIIAAGIGGQPRYAWALTNPASVYVGKISYSLYLWHFPVIIMLAALIPDGSTEYYMWAVAAMAALAVASFHLVEDPVRKSTWLEPSAKSRGGQRRHRGLSSTLGYVFLTALGVGVAVSVVFALQVPALGSHTATPPAASAATVPDAEPAEGRQAEISAEISAALGATVWPDLNPPIDDAVAEPDSPEWQAGCAHTDLANPESCSFGNADGKSIMVFGDSMALALMPTVRAAFEQDYHVKGIILAGCPLINLQMKFNEPGVDTQCNEFRAAGLEAIAVAKPDLVIITNNYNAAQLHIGDTSANDAWRIAEEETAGQIQANAGKVVIVSPPFGGADPEQCYTNISIPSDCISQISGVWLGVLGADRAAAAASGSEYLDTRLWYCSPGGRCPMFAGLTPIKSDYIHTSAAYAAKLAPVLQESLVPTSTATPVGTAASVTALQPSEPPAEGAAYQLTTAVTAALAATTWPELSPSLDSLTADSNVGGYRMPGP